MSNILELGKELDTLKSNFKTEFEKIKSKYLKDKNGLTIIVSTKSQNPFDFAINIESLK